MVVPPEVPPLAFPETIRYFLQRQPGNTLIPLVPADQLPYKLQGVPSELSQRQIFEERWKFITETSEPAVSLSAVTVVPVAPRYRAPDHDVRNDAAIHTSTEHRQIKQELNGETEAASFTRHNQTPSRIEQKALVTTDTNDKPKSGLSASYPRVCSRIGREDVVVMKDAGNDTKLESRTLSSRTASSRIDHIRILKDTTHGNNHGSPTTTGRLKSDDDKIYCNFWITHGECSWGSRCKYKHEMPSLDILPKVTGHAKYPQWYKEKMAIQSRSPTWMEKRMQKDKENNAGDSDNVDMSAPREFPDPSMLRSMRRKSGGVTKQELPTKKDTQEHASTPQLIEVPPLPLPDNTASAAVPVSVGKQTSAPTLSSTTTPTPSPTATQERETSLTFLRRYSQISSSSDSSDATPPAKPKSKNKWHTKKGKQLPALQPKKIGLAASKYAPTEDENYISKVCRAPTEVPFRRHLERSSSNVGLLMDVDVDDPTIVSLI